jgi:hypothetical protein
MSLGLWWPFLTVLRWRLKIWEYHDAAVVLEYWKPIESQTTGPLQGE